MNNPYNILVAISVLVVLSYLFNLLSGIIRVPSVVLLLITGIGIQLITTQAGINFPETNLLLELLGVTGLIFIVLEGSLDLKLSQQKASLIGKSFLSALLIFVVTTGLIGLLFNQFIEISLKTSIVYAIPLGVISSAIAIPSVHKLMSEKKEFIVYESTFSDIIGIMFFNYMIQEDVTSSSSLVAFGFNFLLIVIISMVATLLLLFLLNYTKSNIKFYLIFAIVILIYSISKMFHLPSLLFILIFGLILNNANLFVRGKMANYLHIERLELVTYELKLITAETAFIIRTFFFLLFGYSINMVLLTDQNVIIVGSLIIFIVLFTRFVFLRVISKSNIFPEMFIAPRGLITIVLFYSIPAQYKTSLFNEGILFFVILSSSIIMMIGLIFMKTTYTEMLDKS